MKDDEKPMTSVHFRYEVFDLDGDDGESTQDLAAAYRAALSRCRREHRSIRIHDRMARGGAWCMRELPADAESIYAARIVARKSRHEG